MIGLRVFLKRELPTWEYVEPFRSIPASNIADCMSRFFAMNQAIKLLSKGEELNMTGYALTVRARPGDNLAFHKALDMAHERDVIIVSNEGTVSHSLMGEVMARYAERKKIAGIVVDGPIRDIDAISQMSLPIYGTGFTPGGPYKTGPGEINVPIACGGVSVMPGDVVVGDKDGVIVVPKADIAVVLEKAQEFQKADRAKLLAAMSGTSKRDWVDASLADLQCEIIDDCWKNNDYLV